jgi:hypothetical protein
VIKRQRIKRIKRSNIVCWGFSPCTGFPWGICVVDMHVYLST